MDFFSQILQEFLIDINKTVFVWLIHLDLTFAFISSKQEQTQRHTFADIVTVTVEFFKG